MASGWQKGLQRIAAITPISWLLARTLHYLDRPLLRLSHGRLSLAGLLTGLPVVMLTTTGSKTGQPRTTPLAGIVDGEYVVLVASYFGSAHHPAWYYNLRAHPQAEVTVAGRTRAYLAREVCGDEYDRYWQRAIQIYAGYAAYRERVQRHIPILLLSPWHDESSRTRLS